MDQMQVRQALETLVKREVQHSYDEKMRLLQSEVNRLQGEVNELRKFLQQTFPLADL